MEQRRRTTYTKREIVLNERTIERIEEQAGKRGVSFAAVAETMLEDVLRDLERDMSEPYPLITEFFDRRVFRVHDEIEGSMSEGEISGTPTDAKEEI